MMTANLISDIIAFENGDESDTKHFPEGTVIEVEDYDDNWFSFEDATGIFYECEERPDDVLEFREKYLEKVNVEDQPIKPYKPVPNMTPLGRRFLLL